MKKLKYMSQVDLMEQKLIESPFHYASYTKIHANEFNGVSFVCEGHPTHKVVSNNRIEYVVITTFAFDKKGRRRSVMTTLTVDGLYCGTREVKYEPKWYGEVKSRQGEKDKVINVLGNSKAKLEGHLI